MTSQGDTGGDGRQSGRRIGLGVLAAGGFALLLTVAAKALAFGRDVALSTVFGADTSTDAFFIANMIPGILWAAFLATINVVILPLYLAKQAEHPTAASRFANESIQIYFALSVVIALICVVFVGPIVHFTAPGAPADTLALATQLTLIMAVGFPFSGYVAIQNSLQQANGRYVAPLTVPVVNNVIAIGGIFAAAAMKDIRIAVLAAVLAWVVQAPIQRLQTRAFDATEPRILMQRETLKRLVLLSGPVMLGTFLDQINIFVGINLAGGLGEGAISQLNYASRLAMFLATTFSMLVAYFFFPRIATAAAAKDDTAAARAVALGVLLVAAATLPPTVVSFVLRQDIVDLVYGHGALSDRDITGTAAAFAAYALGILFVAVREIFNRLFFSYQRMATPLIMGVIAAIVTFVASRWLSQSLGVVGIALSASVGALTYIAGQVLVVAVWKPVLISRTLVVGLLVVLAAAVPGWFALELAAGGLAGWPGVLRLLGGGVAFSAPFGLILLGAAWKAGLLSALTERRV